MDNLNRVPSALASQNSQTIHKHSKTQISFFTNIWRAKKCDLTDIIVKVYVHFWSFTAKKDYLLKPTVKHNHYNIILKIKLFSMYLFSELAYKVKKGFEKYLLLTFFYKFSKIHKHSQTYKKIHKHSQTFTNRVKIHKHSQTFKDAGHPVFQGKNVKLRER